MSATIALVLPVVLETVLRKFIWGKIVDSKHGIRHPRLYAVVDVVLSVVSTVTGPVKTLIRVIGAVVCLLAHLFRSDVGMMLDRSFLALDPHFRASIGLLTSLRVQMEFNKLRRHHKSSATASNVANDVEPVAASGTISIPLVELNVDGLEQASPALTARSDL